MLVHHKSGRAITSRCRPFSVLLKICPIIARFGVQLATTYKYRFSAFEFLTVFFPPGTSQHHGNHHKSLESGGLSNVLPDNDSKCCGAYSRCFEWNIRRLTSSLVQSGPLLRHSVCARYRKSESFSHTTVFELDMERHAPRQIIRRYLSRPIRY